jgi:GAF domain-containing protein
LTVRLQLWQNKERPFLHPRTRFCGTLTMTYGMHHPLDGDAGFGITTDRSAGSISFVSPAEKIFPTSQALSDEQLVAIHEVVQILAHERHLHRALAILAEKARALTGCMSTALALLDSSRENLDFVAVAGRGAAEMIGQKVRVGDALPGQTAISGEPLLAYSPPNGQSVDDKHQPNVTLDLLGRERVAVPFFEDDEIFSGGGGVQSAAVVPIFQNGRSIGSLAALNRVDGLSFGGSDLLILHILAGAASSVLQTESLRRQNAQTERERDILFEAAKQTSSTLNVQQILDGVRSTIGKSIDAFAEMVFLLNDDSTHLFIASARGLTEEELEIQLLAEDPLASAAFAGSGGTSYIISNGIKDPRYEIILPLDRAKPDSLLVVPLVSRDNPMGLIIVASLHPHAFTGEDLRLVSAVAAQAAVAVENAWLYEDATRRAEEATAIYELSQSVNTNLNLNRVLNFVADSVIGLLHVDKFALFLHNPKTNHLEIMVDRNLARSFVQEMRCRAEQGGIAWWVYRFETPTAVQNVAADHRNRSCPIDQEQVASLVSVPLQAGDKVIGVIHAMSSRPRMFTVAEMELLYTIANQVGVAIRNTQTIEDMRQKSVELRRASRRVSRALGASLDSPRAAQTITQLAAELIGADRCLIYSLEHQTLKVLAAHGVRLAASTTTVPLSSILGAEPETSAAWIARKRRSLVLPKLPTEGRLVVQPDLQTLVGKTGSYIGIPLKVGDEIVGVLEAYMRDQRKLTTDEIKHFKSFGGQAAVALQNAILVQKATRRRTDLMMLSTLASNLSGQTSLESTIYETLGDLGDAVHADTATLTWKSCDYTWSRNSNDGIDKASDQSSGLRFPASDGLSQVVICKSSLAGFTEPDRYLTQTVSNLLFAALGSKV